MATKAEAIGELEQKYTAFRAKIADLPDAAYYERWLGEWGLIELLAHMGGWFKEMTFAMQRVGRGERPTPEGVDFSNADAWNAKFTATATPGKHGLAAFDAYFKRYSAAAGALSEEMYGVDATSAKPKIGNRLLQGAGIHHFEEHGAELDAWLASRK
jgi:hypothetical protein